MAEIIRTCPQCYHPLTASIGQFADTGHCHWHESRHCIICGYTVEIDGHEDAIEPDIRQAILAQEGSWTLAVPTYSHHALQIAKTLRSLFGLTLTEAAVLLHSHQDALLIGTRAEMRWIAYILAQNGIESELIQGKVPQAKVQLTVTLHHHYTLTIRA
jgi:hypothetical protein